MPEKTEGYYMFRHQWPDLYEEVQPELVVVELVQVDVVTVETFG